MHACAHARAFFSPQCLSLAHARARVFGALSPLSPIILSLVPLRPSVPRYFLFCPSLARVISLSFLPAVAVTDARVCSVLFLLCRMHLLWCCLSVTGDFRTQMCLCVSCVSVCLCLCALSCSAMHTRITLARSVRVSHERVTSHV